jgi:hypothetical protein
MRHAEPHLRIRRFRKEPTGFHLARKGPPDMRRATYRICNDPPGLLSWAHGPDADGALPSGYASSHPGLAGPVRIRTATPRPIVAG